MLELHRRQAEQIFDVMDHELATKKNFTLDDFYAIIRKHILDDPLHLPLITLVMGSVGRSLQLDDVLRFQLAFGERIMRTAPALERALGLRPGDGPFFIEHAFALIIGLWQRGGCGRMVPAKLKATDPKLHAFINADPRDIRQALDRLWKSIEDGPRTNAVKSDRGGTKKTRRGK